MNKTFPGSLLTCLWSSDLVEIAMGIGNEDQEVKQTHPRLILDPLQSSPRGTLSFVPTAQAPFWPHDQDCRNQHRPGARRLHILGKSLLGSSCLCKATLCFFRGDPGPYAQLCPSDILKQRVGRQWTHLTLQYFFSS